MNLKQPCRFWRGCFFIEHVSDEASVIQATLARFNGHRVKTAQALGIHKTTLLRKMKKLGVTWSRRHQG